MDKALDLLTLAAEKIGLEAARVWPEVVKLHWAINLAQAGFWLVMLLGGGAVLAWCARQYSRTEEDGYAVVLVVGGAVIFILVAVALVEGPPVIGALFAPEASLIRSMVGK